MNAATKERREVYSAAEDIRRWTHGPGVERWRIEKLAKAILSEAELKREIEAERDFEGGIRE